MRVSTGTGARFAILSLLLVVASVLAGPAPSPEQLRKRQQELDTQLLEERTRILATDAQAIRIREQIAQLYRDLEALVEAKPSVKKLRLERAAVHKGLADQGRAGDNAPPAKAVKREGNAD